MTDNIIKQVPEILEHPIVIMRSKSKESRLTMFGEVYSDNKPILTVLELMPTGRKGYLFIKFKIVSAYRKDDAQYFINFSEILYIDNNKKRVNSWEKRTRLQLPVGIFTVNSIDSISEKILLSITSSCSAI